MQSVLTEDLRDTSAYGVKVAGERVAFKKLYLRMGNGEEKAEVCHYTRNGLKFSGNRFME